MTKIKNIFIGFIATALFLFTFVYLLIRCADIIDKDFVTENELPDFCVTDINSIRLITECDHFPDFETGKIWYYKKDSLHRVPYMECHFKNEMTEEEFQELFGMTKNIYWESDKDGTLRFSRGWSKKEYMKIPNGMQECMVVTIEHLSQSGFILSFKKNVNNVMIDKDFLYKLAGTTFPDFSIVNYSADDDCIRANLMFDNLISKETVDRFQSSDTLEIKIDTILNNKWIFFSMLRNEIYADVLISNRK